MDRLISAISELLENENNYTTEAASYELEKVPDFEDEKSLLAFYKKYYATLQRIIHRKNLMIREMATELAVSSFFPAETQSRKLKAAAGGIDISFSGYSVIYVRVVDSSNLFYSEGPGENHDQAVKTIVCSIFGELLSECFNSDYAVVDGDFVFLVGSDLEEEAFLKNLSRISKSAVELIEGSFALGLLACVGPYCGDFNLINECFRMTMDLREYSMSLSEPPSLLVSEDVKITKPGMPSEDEFMSAVVDHQYMNAVISYDFESALEMTMGLIATRYGAAPNKRRGLKPFLSARLATTAELLSCSFKGIVVGGISAQTEIDRMLASSDINEVMESLEVVYNILDEFYNHSGHEHVGTVGNVIAYVTENYAISSLSVGSICEELGKSRSYLSRIFKESTGMNLLDFLHTTRITEAKRLLVDTDLSITEIGERVGYYSGWTLARVFKRYEGITPSIYRNRLRPRAADNSQ